MVSQAPVLVLFHLLYAVGFSRYGEKSSLNLPHAGGSIKVEEDTNNDLNLHRAFFLVLASLHFYAFTYTCLNQIHINMKIFHM